MKAGALSSSDPQGSSKLNRHGAQRGQLASAKCCLLARGVMGISRLLDPNERYKIVCSVQKTKENWKEIYQTSHVRLMDDFLPFFKEFSD